MSVILNFFMAGSRLIFSPFLSCMPNVVYERIYNAMLFFVHVKLVFLLLSSHLHKEFKKCHLHYLDLLLQQIIMLCLFYLPFKAMLY